MTPETNEWTGLTDATTLISAFAVNERPEIKADVRKIDFK
tara:strand:- start:177 stop:296 length:120 start_codon:yes stop_codon:yes gene_type:complete